MSSGSSGSMAVIIYALNSASGILVSRTGRKYNPLPIYGDEIMAESKGVVIAAFFANAVIAILKFVGYLFTGSPSMLSETYHSISDTGNQVLLFIGITYSEREPDRQHPFGYGGAQFFYSFLVSVLLFGIAGWESLLQGYEKLTGHGGGETSQVINLPLLPPFNPNLPFDPVWVNVGVLVGAIIFEAYAWKKAYDGLTTQIDEYGWSGLTEAFRKTSDVPTLTAFTEDSIAAAGAAIALVGVLLSYYTGNEIYDAAAALIIGLLLMGFAVALAWENKRLLVGESLDASVEDELRRTIREHEGILHVDDLRSMYIGAQQAFVTADVSFDRSLDTGEIDEDITEIERKLKEVDDRVKIVLIEPEI